jgi:hypothetical protein
MTLRARAIVTVFTSLAASSAATAAHAGEGDYPLVYGQRPLVLTKGLQQAEGAFGFFQPDVSGADMSVSLLASYELGISEELTAGIIAVPLGLSPEVAYGQPVAYATLRLVDAEGYDVGVRGRVTFPGPDGGDLGLGAGVVGRFRLNKAAWADFGGLLNVILADPSVTTVEIPLNLAVSFTRQLFFTLDTSLSLPEVSFDGAFVSSFAGLGYTVGVETPRFEVFARAGLPHLRLEEPVTYDTQVQLGGRYFFR